MQPTHYPPCRQRRLTPPRRHAGFSLISALIALLVFSFGSLAMVAAYLRIPVLLLDNQMFSQAGTLANSLQSIINTSPSLKASLTNGFSLKTETGNAALTDWQAQVSAALPAAAVTTAACSVTVADPLPAPPKKGTETPAAETLCDKDTACLLGNYCLITVTLSWTLKNLDTQKNDVRNRVFIIPALPG